MAFVDSILDRIGRWIAGVLEEESSGYEPFTPSDPITLRRTLQPGDVLLVEGNQKISAAIKYLTQSTWSHAAIYVGDALGPGANGGEPNTLVEADLGHGVVAVKLTKYSSYNTRICRPVNLTVADRQAVIDFVVRRIGQKYDTRNIIDLIRYLLPAPPIPIRWRRRMLSLGSGEPTRTICSTMIAEAFQSIHYPILPRAERMADGRRNFSSYSQREIFHIRHHSLFAPRDFDLSPYFRVVKPTIDDGFSYKSIVWGSQSGDGEDGETEGASNGD